MENYLLPQRLAFLRKEKGLSQYELAKALGFSRGQIANYEQGSRRPDPATLQRLADYFNVSVDYLLGRNNVIADALNVAELKAVYSVNQMVKIPVLGVIRAGIPIFAQQNIIGWEDIPADEVKDGEYFYLQVTGDSMIDAHIFPGSRVLIQRQEYVANGQIAVVLVGGTEATLKRVKWADGKVILYVANKDYEPQIYDAAEVKILGRAVKAVTTLD
ncbi:MAG: helix-turn-helix domain-containing protein [Firmicutes bacterium]|nr:helix-turn-helix domain-containing protein [Bacillota bacterium]